MRPSIETGPRRCSMDLVRDGIILLQPDSVTSLVPGPRSQTSCLGQRSHGHFAPRTALCFFHV